MAHAKGDSVERSYRAAIELFGEHGYARTTVDEIVSALLHDGLQHLAAGIREEVRDVEGPVETLRALVHAELTYV